MSLTPDQPGEADHGRGYNGRDGTTSQELRIPLSQRSRSTPKLENQAAGPPISVKATGTILNPWYTSDLNDNFCGPGFADPFPRSAEVVCRCRVDLKDHALMLLFHHDEIVFLFTDDSTAPRYLVNPIRYFLSYQTFLNYNLFGISPHVPDVSQLATLPQGEFVRFRLQRNVQVETEIQQGSASVGGFYYTSKDEWLTLEVDRIASYLSILNPTLYYALAFYLIGCDNQRYFLVEFYKAVEAIKHALGSEHAFLTTLEPYGVKKGKFKDFGSMCNDAIRAPLDIGRHAPKPGAILYAIDLRRLLVEPRSRDVFESATVFCRQVIDAYMTYLRQLPKT